LKTLKVLVLKTLLDLIFYDILIISRSLGGLTGDDAKMTNDLIEDLGGNIIDDENNENSYPV
jgi:hypothetical protein